MPRIVSLPSATSYSNLSDLFHISPSGNTLYKGGVPATPSGTATLLRLSPSRWFYPNEVSYLPLQVYPTPMA